MVKDINYWSGVIKRFFSLVLTIMLIYLVLKLSIFYLPFLISFILAILIEPIIRILMKKLKWTRKASSIFVMIISITIIIGILIWGGTTIFSEVSNILDGIDNYFYKIKDLINNSFKNEYIIDKIPEELRSTIENAEAEYINSISNLFIKLLNDLKQWIGKIPNLLTTLFFLLIALYFMCTDKIYMIDQVEHHLPDNLSKKLISHIRGITKKIGNYLKAEIILIIISFFISFAGLIVFKMVGLNIKYPLMSALLIGFVDALPILGSGTAMIPWAIISSLEGDITLGIAIMVLWIIMTIMRNVIEPKLVSNNIGIHPVFTIISMYTGYKLIGIIGMIVGPVLLIILKEIFMPLVEKGIFRALFETN